MKTPKRYRFLYGVIVCLLSVCLTVCLAALSGCAPGKTEPTETDDPPATTAPAEEEEEELPEYPVTIGDVTVRSRPSRVISLSPGLTEKLYDLGLEEALAGVSDYCDYPEAVVGLPTCGTAQIPDLQEIEALKPHLVLTQTPLPEETVIALQQMQADVVVIPTATTVEGFKENYISLAKLLEGTYTGGDMGTRFAANVQDRLDYLAGYLVPYAEENGVKPALYLRLLEFNVATGDTLEHELMEIIGLKNIAAEQTGWLYPEEIAKGAGRADFQSLAVMFMDDEFVTIKHLEQNAFYKGLNATLKDYFLYIDSLVFERQSLRMLDILEEMALYAYPEATPPLPFGDTEEDGANVKDAKKDNA